MFCAKYELIFLPLTYELSIPLQLQEVDVILHKATDDIVSIDLDTSLLCPKITYTNGMEELKRYLYILKLPFPPFEMKMNFLFIDETNARAILVRVIRFE